MLNSLLLYREGGIVEMKRESTLTLAKFNPVHPGFHNIEYSSFYSQFYHGFNGDFGTLRISRHESF